MNFTARQFGRIAERRERGITENIVLSKVRFKINILQIMKLKVIILWFLKYLWKIQYDWKPFLIQVKDDVGYALGVSDLTVHFMDTVFWRTEQKNNSVPNTLPTTLQTLEELIKVRNLKGYDNSR